METQPLVAPFCLPNTTSSLPRSSRGNKINEACSTAIPTTLISWSVDSPGNHLVAMGCNDGTTFILSTLKPPNENALQVSSPTVTVGKSPRRLESLSGSLRRTKAPSPTPSKISTRSSVSQSQPPSLIQPRSRISASLSKTQVEVPKTHVDYDDEQDKLRSMLKTGSTSSISGRRSRHSTDQSTRPRSPLASPAATSSLSFNDDDGERSPSNESSGPISPNTPTLSLPNPYSPLRLASSPYDFPQLSLKLHILPPRIGYGHAVTSLKLIEGNTLIACLQECGTLSIFSPVDGACVTFARLNELPQVLPPTGHNQPKVIPESLGLYSWGNMRVAQDGESTLLVLTSSLRVETPSYANVEIHQNPTPKLSYKVTVVRVRSPYEREFTSTPEEILEKTGEWFYDGPVQCAGLYVDDDGELSMYHVNSDLLLVSEQIRFLSQPASPPAAVQELGTPHSNSYLPLSQSISMPQIQINIPNPFKSSGTVRHRRHQSHYATSRLKGTSRPTSTATNIDLPQGRIELGAERILGSIAPDGELRASESDKFILVLLEGQGVMGAFWHDLGFWIYQLDLITKKLERLVFQPYQAVQSISWLGERKFMVHGERSATVYVINVTDSNNDEVGTGNTSTVIYSLETLNDFRFAGLGTIQLLASSSVLLVSIRDSSSDQTRLETRPFSTLGEPGSLQSRRLRPKNDIKVVWSLDGEVEDQNTSQTTQAAMTTILPIDVSTFFIGLADGKVGKTSFRHLVGLGRPQHAIEISSNGLDGSVTMLFAVTNSGTGEKFLFGSTEDGSIGVWNLKNLRLCARWTVFATPLLAIIDLTGEENVGGLKDCLLCVAEHGTIAVIAIDGWELLYLIPGSSAPLERISVGGDNLLLIYSDGKGRLWDIKSQEFWRSMTREKADDLLEQGGWFEVDIDQEGPRFTGAFGVGRQTASSRELASVIFMDIKELVGRVRRPAVAQTSRRLKSASEEEDTSLPAVQILRDILSVLISPKLEKEADLLRAALLGMEGGIHQSISAISGFHGSSAFVTHTEDYAWKVSSAVSASRLLSILSLLRAAVAYEELEPIASQLINLYTTSLPDLVGLGYQAPSIEMLVCYWFDPCNELKQSARGLFSAIIERMSDDEVAETIEMWKHRLPCLQPEAQKEALFSAQALIVTGHLAVENHALLAINTLKDIAKSITMYLHDETSMHRIIAIELCSLGFHIWQHYVDAMEILRSLFTIATSPKKETSTQGAAAGPQARTAILQIASSNTPLFITTLSLDILHPQSMEHRKSIMQVVAFIIRKKPLILYANLSRLIEAVVKSLDPNSSSGRETVLEAAIEILGHVVATFPSVDFHKATQRLAVGTNEGALIMYDLKTATRLYVLEGHKKRISACSFSPNGRRLVSASLEESVVMVWKVGSSFTSIFNPGAPPRQGGNGTEAFRKLDFNVGDEAYMTIASTLDWVAFEWPDEQTARLKIRDSALTFHT